MTIGSPSVIFPHDFSKGGRFSARVWLRIVPEEETYQPGQNER